MNPIENHVDASVIHLVLDIRENLVALREQLAAVAANNEQVTLALNRVAAAWEHVAEQTATKDQYAEAVAALRGIYEALTRRVDDAGPSSEPWRESLKPDQDDENN